MKKRVVWSSVLLLCAFLVIKFFLGGKYFSVEELLPELLIFGVVTLVMMLVPVVWRIVSKGRMERKKGVLVCLLNSLVLTVLAIVPNVVTIVRLTGREDMTMSWSPVAFAKGAIVVHILLGVIYYFVNWLLFVERD